MKSKTLVLSHIPDDISARHKDLRGRSRIDGGETFYSTATAALIDYSTYERLYVLDNTRQSRYALDKARELAGIPNRVVALGPREAINLSPADDIVLFTPTESPALLLPFRRYMRLSRTPIIGFLHAASPNWILPRLCALLIERYEKQDALICASVASRHAAIEQLSVVHRNICSHNDQWLPAFQMPLIPNGVDCRSFAVQDRGGARARFGIDTDEVVILYLGRFNMYGKSDLGPLAHVVAGVASDTGVKLRLVLAGADDGDLLRDNVTAYCDSAFSASSVLVVSNCDDSDKRLLYHSADIFVSPADGIAESFGISIIEAMASGLPIVASDWNGYRESVVHGETGFRVPTLWPDLGIAPEYLEAFGLPAVASISIGTILDPDRLAYYLRLLVSDSELRRQMGNAGLLRAKRLFDWPAVVRQYEQLFDECLAIGKQRPTPTSATDLGIQSMFATYPTRSLIESDQVVITKSGHEWLRQPTPLGISYTIGENNPTAAAAVALRRFRIIDDELSATIVSSLERGKPRLILDLVEEFSDTNQCPRWLVRLQIARLLKYRMIRIAATPGLKGLGVDSTDTLPVYGQHSPASHAQTGRPVCGKHGL